MRSIGPIALLVAICGLVGCPRPEAPPPPQKQPAPKGVDAVGARDVAEEWIRSGGTAIGLLVPDPTPAVAAASRTSRFPLSGTPRKVRFRKEGVSDAAGSPELRHEAFRLESPMVVAAVVSYDVEFTAEFDMDGGVTREVLVVSLRPHGGDWRVVPPAPGRTFDLQLEEKASDGPLQVTLTRLAVLERTAENLEAEVLSKDLKAPRDGYYRVCAVRIEVDGVARRDLPRGAIRSVGPLEIHQAGQRLGLSRFGQSYVGDTEGEMLFWDSVDPVFSTAPLQVELTVDLEEGGKRTVVFGGIQLPGK